MLVDVVRSCAVWLWGRWSFWGPLRGQALLPQGVGAGLEGGAGLRFAFTGMVLVVEFGASGDAFLLFQGGEAFGEGAVDAVVSVAAE